MPRIPRGGGGAEETAPPAEQALAGDEAPTTEAPAVPAGDHATAMPAPDGATIEQPATPAPAATPRDTTSEPSDATATATEVTASGSGEASGAAAAPVEDAAPRFRERARMRRRLRYLRRLRELAFRDLGGLVFDLHRFGRDRGDLVQGKLDALGEIDAELRTLETALRDRRDHIDLREAGVAACPRCGTLHDTGSNFCPGCGTSLKRSVVRDAAPVSVTPAEGEQPGAAQS